MLTMTFDEYDSMLEHFQKGKPANYYPGVLEMDQFDGRDERWVKFAVFLYECNEPPKNNEEKYSKKNLQHFINENLTLV